MKKRTLNKILAFTLCCVIASATVVNAKQTNQSKTYKQSSYCDSVSLPSDPEERH